MLTINGSLHLSVYNPATFFGIYVTSTPVKFIYADIVIASGQVRWFCYLILLLSLINKYCSLSYKPMNPFTC